MDKKTAKLFLDNLLARVVIDPETGQRTLEGILTPKEFEALEMASALLEESESIEVTSPVIPEPEPTAEPEPVQASEPEPDSEAESASELEPEPEAESEQESEPESVPEPEPEQEQEPDNETNLEPEAELEFEPAPESEPESTAETVAELDEESEPGPEEEQEITLNLRSITFDAPQNPSMRMCLDFGTAMSKAFASDIEGDEITEGLKLKLGHRASGGTSKDIYPVPSSLWIAEDGKIYMGEEAIARSLHSDPSGNRQRFDSLKRELILGMKESSPFQETMNQSLNPTDCPLSNGDAITLYLGYLTDLACTEMEEAHQCSRYVLRNFGLPSWAPERRVWGEEILRTMLVKAQIVADTFHSKWENGVSIHAVKSVLEKIDNLDKLPDYLVAQGITEPLAVGSSRLRQNEPSRGLVMVVDVGAGTSDLALFVVVENPERKLFNAFPIQGCNQSLHMAGDTLDSAMLQTILKKAGIKSHDHDYPSIFQLLRRQVRSLKEDLFRDGYCTVNLVNGARVRIDRDEFLRQDSVNRFKMRLEEKFEDVLKAMNKGLAQHFGQGGLSVVLTGGGATLPMVRELAVGAFSVHSTHIRKDEVPLVPEDFEYDAELATVYPQLAVAIGGTMPFLIDEKYTIDDIDIPQGKFTLNRTQVSGS